jgi:hypothetical protein
LAGLRSIYMKIAHWSRPLVCGLGVLLVALVAFAVGRGFSWSDLPSPTTNERGQQCFDFQMPPVFVEQGSPVVYELPVVNNGAKKLRILKVEASCACTKSELGTTELQPKQRTILRLESDMRNRVGPFRLTCRLLTDDEEQPDWLYSIATTAYQKVSFAPASLCIGIVEVGSERNAEAELQLCAANGHPVPEVVSVESLSSDVCMEQLRGTDEQVEGGKRRRIPLRITVRGQELPGSFGTQIVAKCSVGEEIVEANLQLSWSVRGFYETFPSVVYFGLVKPGDAPVTQEVRVRRQDGRSFAILKVETDTVAVTCAAECQDDSKKRVTMTLHPDLVEGPMSGKVVIETDDPQHRFLEVGFSVLR